MVSTRYAVAVLAAVGAAAVLAIPAAAQNKMQVDDVSHHPFATDFPSGGQLNLYIRSAEIHIVGSDENKVTVRIGGGEGTESTDIHARFERSGNSGDLDVSGGPHNDVSITVKVPRNSNLVVRIPAGDVEVEGITGDKDIRLRAGDLRISVGDPADYARVEASVTSGDISARPFGEFHGGLFRSFEKTGNGKYKLVARLWAGDLTLK
ncbi:MAG TPA: hypothetical protein VLY23_09860 [Candidatus Acidoferrum sp.]|nr:hypothetical protein [Candidatus Acidoferrum sp.]